MGRHIFSIMLSLVAAITSGAIFLVSLFHQFAIVEIAASLLTGLQVFSLGSAIAIRGKNSDTDRVANHVRSAKPQPSEWQRVRN